MTAEDRPAVLIRDPQWSELDALAALWHQGWRDAHAGIIPESLARFRTLESFRQRLEDGFSSIRVAGPAGECRGFAMVKGNELYQLYVSADWRGAGIAAALIADAEARMAAGGITVAWLACAIGNDRAARFYEKSGWHRAGIYANRLETPEGEYLLDVWRYEKRVGG